MMDPNKKATLIKLLNAWRAKSKFDNTAWDASNFSDELLTAIGDYLIANKNIIDFSMLGELISNTINNPHFITQPYFNALNIATNNKLSFPENFNYLALYRFLKNKNLIEIDESHQYTFNKLLKLIEDFNKSTFAKFNPEDFNLTLTAKLYLFIQFPDIDLSDLATGWDTLKLELLNKAVAKYESSIDPDAYDLIFGSKGDAINIFEYLDTPLDIQNIDKKTLESLNNFVAYRIQLLTCLKTNGISEDIVNAIDAKIRDIVSKAIQAILNNPNPNKDKWEFFAEIIHASLVKLLKDFIKDLPSSPFKKTYENVITQIDLTDIEIDFGKFGLKVGKYLNLNIPQLIESTGAGLTTTITYTDETPDNTSTIATPAAVPTTNTLSTAPTSTTNETPTKNPNFLQRHKRALIGFGIGLSVAVGIGLLVAATLFTLGAIHIITAPTLFALLVTVGVPTTLKFLTIPAVTTGTAEIIAASTVAGSTASITTGLGVTGAAIGHGLDKKRKREATEEEQAKPKRTQAAQQSPAPGDISAQSSQEYTAPSPSK